ncbi:MAG: flagellar biosynthetic protein FliR [Lachnospiraceae bacterium]|nr:flagellar biosynthetic protein FliR [Lachnospiraceae bacterium]
MTVSLDHLEYFLLILVRISGFMVAAPIFSLRNIPMRVKTLLALAIAIVVFHVIPYQEVQYSTTIEYAIVVITEMLAGLIMGFMANVSYYILSFAGQIIDQEIGFSMVNQFDPITSAQVTITGNLYTYAVMLMVIITNMHHYLIRAITDSFQIIPVGGVVLDFNLYEVMKRFVVDYFVLGFRIVLPIFASLLVVNTILAILARVAPQMNMFVIGLQLKVFVGLVVLVLMVMMITGVADLIFREMMSMLRETIPYLGGTDG